MPYCGGSNRIEKNKIVIEFSTSLDPTSTVIGGIIQSFGGC